MTDVFISYKRRIRDRVAPIAEALERLGLDVWFDAHIGVGTGFITEINKQVRAARCVLVCWTPDAFEIEEDNPTSWVVSEATIGRQRRVLVPVLLEPTDVYAPFNTFHTEDLSAWPEGVGSSRAWIATLAAIGEMTNRPGLAGYVEADADGSSEALRGWVTRYPEDQLADGVWDRIATLEAEALKQRLAADRRAAGEAAAAAKVAAEARVKAQADAKLRAAEDAKRLEAERIEAKERAIVQAEADRIAEAELRSAADEAARLANEQRVLAERAEDERREAKAASDARDAADAENARRLAEQREADERVERLRIETLEREAKQARTDRERQARESAAAASAAANPKDAAQSPDPASGRTSPPLIRWFVYAGCIGALLFTAALFLLTNLSPYSSPRLFAIAGGIIYALPLVYRLFRTGVRLWRGAVFAVAVGLGLTLALMFRDFLFGVWSSSYQYDLYIALVSGVGGSVIGAGVPLVVLFVTGSVRWKVATLGILALGVAALGALTAVGLAVLEGASYGVLLPEMMITVPWQIGFATMVGRLVVDPQREKQAASAAIVGARGARTAILVHALAMGGLVVAFLGGIALARDPGGALVEVFSFFALVPLLVYFVRSGQLRWWRAVLVGLAIPVCAVAASFVASLFFYGTMDTSHIGFFGMLVAGFGIALLLAAWRILIPSLSLRRNPGPVIAAAAVIVAAGYLGAVSVYNAGPQAMFWGILAIVATTGGLLIRLVTDRPPAKTQPAFSASSM